MLKKIQKWIYNMIKHYRFRIIFKLIDGRNKTILDMGCQDLYLYNKLKMKFKITLSDYEPKSKIIKKENVECLSFKNSSFDTVLCLEVLEHTNDPVKAIKELARVTKKDLIISVPNEPFFTLFRLLVWEDEHMWAITPKILKHYLGKPIFEKRIFFKRYYVAKWSFQK